MVDPIIRVEGLSKRYRIGARGQIPKTLSSLMVKAISSPFDYLKKVLREPTEEETLWALKDISFEIKRGEVVGIIGSNGAGKSTLLKILSRITKPTAGYAEIYGRVGSLLEVGTGFHPELTGRENIYLNGNILGMKQREIDKNLDKIIAFAELDKFINTPVKHYSSGMYVRLAFAVAAHLEPEILIIDEVLAVGDIAFQKKCLGKMENVANQEGRTVLFVSHNLGAINQLCHSCIYLKAGKIQDIGKTSTIVRQYLADSVELAPVQTSVTKQNSSKFSIQSLYIANQHNQKVNLIEFSNPFTIIVQYHVNQPIINLQLCFRIVNSQGISVLFTADRDYSYSLDRQTTLTQPGYYQSKVPIPGHLLFPDQYSIDVVAETHRVEVFEERNYCFAFQIISEGEMNPDESGWGLVYPRLQWTTEPLN